MLPLNEINFRLCKYRIDSIILNVPDIGEYQVNTFGLGDFVIEKVFDGFQYPYFRVFISVPNKVFRAMRKNHHEITAYVRVLYAYFNPEETSGAPGLKIKEQTYISDNFVVELEDSSPHLTTDTEELSEKQTLTDDKGPDPQHMATMEILLYKQNDMNIIKKLPTVVYHNATIMDILTDYLRLAGLHNVLCSPANNNSKRYSQFIIPPMRVDEQILRICCDYGLHKYGTSFFMDFDKPYIIEKINKCTAWVPNEYKTIYVVNPNFSNQVSSITKGCSYETKDHCGYCTMLTAQSDAPSMEREQVFGSSIYALDKHTGNYTEIRPDVTTIRGGGNISRVVGSYYGDPSTIKALEQRIKEDTNVMTVILDAVDLTMLEPNKLYKLCFTVPSQTKYDGDYRLVKYHASFTLSDGIWFTPNVVATFVGDKPK